MLRELRRAPWWAKAILGLVAAFIALAIIGSAMGSDDGPPSPQVVRPTTTAEPATTVPTSEPTETPKPTKAPAATKKPDRGVTGCDLDDAGDALDTLRPYQERFSDAFARAQAASRIALTPVIADMQEIRRDLVAEDIPSCAAIIKAAFIRAFDESIDGFLAFQGGSDDIGAYFDRASEYITVASDYIEGINPP